MHTKLALVGAATLGAQAALASCPLAVEISNVEGHQVDVTVTNTGAESLAVFKGNTVLIDHPTMDVKVTTEAGDAIPFSGKYFNYKRQDFSTAMLESIPAGSSVTKTVNVASTFDLAGVSQATVAAVQNFYYQSANSTNSNLYDMSSCSTTSGDVQITPDQSTIKRDFASRTPMSRIQKRAVTYSGCTTSETSTLKTSVADAITMSSNAITAASSSADYYTTWFKSTSVLTKVKTIFTDVVNVATTAPIIYCTDFDSGCSSDVIAYTEPSANKIAVCPDGGFWGFPQEASTCADSDYDQAGTILHESTHLYGTDDYAYGEADSVKLTAAQAAANADTYELYAASVRLGGCS